MKTGMSQSGRLAVFFSLLLFFCQQPLHASEIVLNALKTHLIESPDKNYWYDPETGLKTAGEIYQLFLKKAGDPPPEIYSIPGLNRYYLVSVNQGNPTKTDCGPHIFLIKKDQKGIAILDKTQGCGDLIGLAPHFYSKDGKVLVLAENESEDGSMGYDIYWILNEKIKKLGPLYVIFEDATSEGPDVSTAPVPSRVLAHGSGWRIEFKENLLLELPDLGRKVTKLQFLKRHGDLPIRFDFDGKQFVLDETSCDVTREKEQNWSGR